jgi:hypothetical protein
LKTYRQGALSGFDPVQTAALRAEFGRIREALERAFPDLTWDVLHAEPSKLVAGMVVIADGADWNPGFGAGLYRRNAANSAWVFLESTGTVTTLSVASANGFAGTVANPTTTPAITLTTSITGVLKGNGTAISASVVTDDVQTKAAIVPNTAPSAGQMLVGNAGATAYAPVSASGAVTLASTGAFSLATPGTLTVSTTNTGGTGAHVHTITSSNNPGAAASLLATDASGHIGVTGNRIVKGWFVDLTVTNAIAASITGSAPTLTTARSIYGSNFDGSAALSGIIASTFGGTGNGFTKFSGPATAEKTKTLRDASDTILELGGTYTPTGTWTFAAAPAILGVGAAAAYTMKESATYGILWTTSVGGASNEMLFSNNGGSALAYTFNNGSVGTNQHFRSTAPVTETAATHTIASTTNYLIANRAGTITVTFPVPATYTGRSIIIKTIQAQTVVSASSNVVPLNGGAASTPILAATIGKWAQLVSDGTSWVIMAAA